MSLNFDEYLSKPIGLFVNNINIDPNSIDTEEIEEHIKLTKKIKEKDKESIDFIVENFTKQRSVYLLFCFGEVSSEDEGDLSNFNKQEFYQTLIEEIQKTQEKSIKDNSYLLSISFSINNFNFIFDIYNQNLTPVFGNGDILLIDECFYMCNEGEITEVESDILKNIVKQEA